MQYASAVRFAFASTLALVLGCSKSQTERMGATEPDGGDQAFVETQPTGTVAWNVRPSGEVESLDAV